jgi:hypothetical protein
VQPGYHEIVQIAIVPLDADIKPLAGIADVRPFYTHLRPVAGVRPLDARIKPLHLEQKEAAGTQRQNTGMETHRAGFAPDSRLSSAHPTCELTSNPAQGILFGALGAFWHSVNGVLARV